jgi:hypothetical protein
MNPTPGTIGSGAHTIAVPVPFAMLLRCCAGREAVVQSANQVGGRETADLLRAPSAEMLAGGVNRERCKSYFPWGRHIFHGFATIPQQFFRSNDLQTGTAS